MTRLTEVLVCLSEEQEVLEWDIKIDIHIMVSLVGKKQLRQRRLICGTDFIHIQDGFLPGGLPREWSIL
jgi:hypothetical protein